MWSIDYLHFYLPLRENLPQVPGSQNVPERGCGQGPGGGVVVVHVTHRLVAVVHLDTAAVDLSSFRSVIMMMKYSTLVKGIPDIAAEENHCLPCST